MSFVLMILGILYLGYCLTGGIVAVNAWCRRVADDPEAPEDDAALAALMEGAFWPVVAWHVWQGREEYSDDGR